MVTRLGRTPGSFINNLCWAKRRQNLKFQTTPQWNSMVIFLILSYRNIFWDFRYEILTSQILVSCNSLVRLSCNLCIKYTPNQQPPYPNVQQIFRRMLLCSQNVRKDRLVYFHFLRRMMPLFRSCSHYLSKTDRLRYRHIGASTKSTILKDQPCKGPSLK